MTCLKSCIHFLSNFHFIVKTGGKLYKDVINVIFRMKNHECPRCGYKTTNRCDFKRHLTRKTICEPEVNDISLDDIKRLYLSVKEINYTCSKCSKGFTSRTGLKYHISQCTAEPPHPLIPIQTDDDNSVAKKVESLEQQIQMLIQMLKEQSPSPNVTHIHNIQQNIQQNIIIRNFGAENVSHLIDDVTFMKSCFMNYEKGLIQYILRKWFSKDHPENSNIRMVDIRESIIEYYESNRWKKNGLTERVMDSIMNFVGLEYQQFLEKSPIFEKAFLDKFMTRIGVPLDWDLSHDDYDFDNSVGNKEQCQQIREKLHTMVKADVFGCGIILLKDPESIEDFTKV